MSSSAFQSFQKRSFIPSIPTTTTKQALPVSQTDSKEEQGGGGGGGGGLLRRRLSSLSLKLQPSSDRNATSWVFLRRSKSVSSMGAGAGGGSSNIRKWWEWGWGWILSKRPTFAKDLEMNEEETAVLGCHNKGSWRHVFYKVRSEFRRLVVGGSDNVGLPQSFRYDSFSYSQNFDDGKRSTTQGC